MLIQYIVQQDHETIKFTKRIVTKYDEYDSKRIDVCESNDRDLL